jgi:Zn-dependent protease
MDIRSIVIDIILMVIPMLLAITFHELAHGLIAYRLGDPTAKEEGRLTFNPFRHLDPFGTLAFILTQRIGWAKPVPVNPLYLKNPRRDMMWIAMAGPFTNLVLALLFGLFAGFVGKIGLDPESHFLWAILNPVYLMLRVGVRLNCGLAIFNALPIPPLDGGSILMGILPGRLAIMYSRLEPYGFMVLLFILFFPGVRNFIMGDVIYPLMGVLEEIFLESF